MTLNHLRLRTRFIVLLALLAGGFALYGLWSFRTLAELKVNGPLYQRIVQSKDLIADILPPPEYIIESYLVAMQLGTTGDKPARDALVERLRTLRGEYETRHAYWQKEDLEEPLRRALLQAAHDPAAKFYEVAFGEYIPALQGGNADAASAALARLSGLYDTHRKAIDEVVNMATRRAQSDEKAAADDIVRSTRLMLAILALSVGAGIGMAILTMRSIMLPLQTAVRAAKTVAAGDLTLTIDSHGRDETAELLAALQEMNLNLANIVSRVRSGTHAINDASTQIAAGNLDLSSRTEQQAGSLQETSSAMEELTGTVRQNADHATRASELANAASGIAGKGGAVVSEVVQTMGSINESSKKIVDIISVIDGIAFQTNILALNAAVEAARAGEQGRGFAVVASEVRNLAQRSAAAAKEIKALIHASVEKVDAGTRLVSEAGATMDEVVVSVRRVSDIIAEIAAASREQTSGIEQVNASLVQMDQVTQQNAALVEEAAAAAESLHHQTEQLAEVVSVFRLADAAQSAQGATEARTARLQAVPAPTAPRLPRLTGTA